MSKLIIIDGNALLHRAYHAIQPLTDPKGRVVNAVFGFARVLGKILKDMQPEYMAVAWDRKEKTFRHEAYAEYKAQREKKPQDLYDQIPMISELLDAYSIPHFEKAGFEADDLIGTIATKLKNKVDEIIIVTGDMDTLQLVDDKINVLAFRKGVSETETYTPKKVEERYGLAPKQMIDYKALVGDPSDNIKGVAGIGKVGAQKLISQYGNIDGLYKALEKGKLTASEKTKQILEQGKKAAYQSLDLVTLRNDAPIEISLDEMEFGNYDKEKVNNFYIDYGFHSLLTQTQSTADSRQPTANRIAEIKNIKDIGAVIRAAEENNELIFLIREGQEGLFGKNIEGFWFASGKTMGKIIFGPKLKSEDVFKKLKPVFENEKIKKASHDIKNQMHILDKFGVELRGADPRSGSGASFDIMIAAYLLSSGERKYELDGLVLDYLKKTTSPDIILDIVHLKNLLAEKLKAEKMERVFFEIDMPLVSVLFKMEKNGIMLDKKMLERLSADYAERLAEIDKKIYKFAGPVRGDSSNASNGAGGEFNIDSPQQLKVLLYEKLGLKPAGGRIKKGKTGLSTAASELTKLLGAHPIIDLIMEHRELAKLKNTYLDALPKLADKASRVHTTFNQTVASTGRLSSSAPNLQNIPVRTEAGREIRKAFAAKDGYVLASLDYSQIELRLAAVISGERHMIDAFNHGDDIHAQTAAEIFGIPEKEVTKEMRRKAKTINFGVLYGMGAGGLAVAAKMSRAEAEDFLQRYYAAHPAIVEYIERTKALAYKTGYVETIFGRRRYVPEVKSFIPQVQAAAERMAVNMPIQGTAADIMKMAMIEIDKNVASEDVKMVLQVHDELVFEIKKGKEKKAVADIKEIMENIYKLKVPLLVEAEIGERWE